MAVPFIMPKFEMSQESATIVEWLRGEGDQVDTGDPVLIVETDKVSMEVESPATGILAGIRGEPNQIVPVTEIIAYVLQPGEKLPGTGTPETPAAMGVTIPTEAHGLALSAFAGTGSGRPITKTVAEATLATEPLFGLPQVRATPAARHIAREQAIDLENVIGRGPGGRVQAADVEAYVSDTATAGARAAVSAETEAIEVLPMTGIRRTIARRMAASHQATARVTLVTEADATNLVEARTQLKATVSEVWGFAPGYNDLLALVVARALREYPYMNARLSADEQSIERLPTVNLGIAVDTERGLLVPVIRNAERKGLRAIATEFRALVERARAGRSLPDDLYGGTFTITNLGMCDVDAFTPIVNLPEAAILGAGRIQPRAVVHGGEVAVRQMWTLSLTFDHRLVDGAPAARFVQRIKQSVENPFLLIG